LWTVERRCENFSLRPGTVVFEGKKVKGCEHLCVDCDVEQVDTIFPSIAMPIPNSYVELERLLVEDFEEWEADENFGEIDPPRNLLYLHKLRSRDGASRIVLIGLASPDDGRPSWISAEVFATDGVPGKVDYPFPAALSTIDFSRVQLGIRFYAGQEDPNDPSAFCIPYQIDGRRGELTGQLLNGGNGVALHDSAAVGSSVFR
jgi:hypothetical protein